jgi:hypothetical protein
MQVFTRGNGAVAVSFTLFLAGACGVSSTGAGHDNAAGAAGDKDVAGAAGTAPGSGGDSGEQAAGAGPAASGAGGAGVAGSGSAGAPDFEFPTPAVTLPGKRQTFGTYSFIVPPGLTGAEDQGIFVMQKPADQPVCTLLLFPPMAAEQDRPAQALDILSQAIALLDPTLALSSYANSPLEFYRRGLAGNGWDYVNLHGDVVDAQAQTPVGLASQVTLVNLGKQVAPIVGFESTDDPCLSTNAKVITLPMLYDSLEFSGLGAASRDALASTLLGKWERNDETLYTSYVYAANGRFASFGAVDEVVGVSLDDVLLKTTTFSGDGAFVVQGNQLARFPDGKPGYSVIFRIEEEGPLSAGDWLVHYYELGQDIGDKKYYEDNYISRTN